MHISECNPFFQFRFLLHSKSFYILTSTLVLIPGDILTSHPYHGVFVPTLIPAAWYIVHLSNVHLLCIYYLCIYYLCIFYHFVSAAHTSNSACDSIWPWCFLKWSKMGLHCSIKSSSLWSLIVPVRFTISEYSINFNIHSSLVAISLSFHFCTYRILAQKCSGCFLRINAKMVMFWPVC